MTTNTIAEIAAARDRVASKAGKTASAKPSASRVAAAYLSKQANAGYDQFLRAMMLEGAAGIRFGMWANNNAASNLRKAQKHFAEHLDTMDPSWFSPQDSGAWKVLENRVGAVFRRFKLDDEQRWDVLNSTLFGLNPKLERKKVPAYETGVYAREAILSGGESPKSLAVGYGGQLFVRKAINDAEKLVRQDRLRGKGVDVWEHGDRTEDTSGMDFGQAFLNVITDTGSRAGKLWRNMIQSAFMGTTQEEVGKLYWTGWFQSGNAPGPREIAKATGKSEQLVGLQLKSIRKRITDALRSNPGLFRALEDEIRAMGAEMEDRGTIVDILAPKVASYDLAASTLAEIQQILA